jgi:deoxycytidylate deaminase
VAFIIRGNTVIAAANTGKTYPEFKRTFKNGDSDYSAHAEMACIKRAESLLHLDENDVLHVMRFHKNGTITMAMPCNHCQRYIKRKNIKTVKYTDWSGQWNTMRF